MDPVIAQAGEACGLDPLVIHATFPSELTMWIDPLEVSYRIGENGSICVLYEYKEDGPNDPWRPNNNCKETLQKMDYLLDPRKSVSIEQLAAYISR